MLIMTRRGRHVVESHVHMDINVLCDFMDHLTAAMLVAGRGGGARCLHGLTLPMSWWIRIASDIDSMASKNVDWDKYIQIAERLLHAISSGTGAGKSLDHPDRAIDRSLKSSHDLVNRLSPFREDGSICFEYQLYPLRLPGKSVSPSIRQLLHSD